MAKPFFEHATPQEHFNAINDADFEVQFAMLERDMLAVESAYRVNIALADYKVMTEGGTYDDLQALYEEASNEKSSGSKGIFQRLLDLIKDIFSAFKKLITGEQADALEEYAKTEECKKATVKRGIDTGKVDEGMNVLQKAFKKVQDFVHGKSSESDVTDEIVNTNKKLSEIIPKIVIAGGTGVLPGIITCFQKHLIGVSTFGDSITDCVNAAKEKGGSEFIGVMRGFLTGLKKFMADGLAVVADVISEGSGGLAKIAKIVSSNTIKEIPNALSAAFSQLKDERADRKSSELGDSIKDLEERIKNASSDAERKKLQKRLDRVTKRKDDLDFGRARRTKDFAFKDKEDADKQISELKDEIQKLKDEIEELNKADPVDDDAVDKKEDELDQKERELNDAESQADELDKKSSKDGDDDKGNDGNSSKEESTSTGNSSTSQQPNVKVPDDNDPLPTNTKWFNGSTTTDLGDFNVFCQVLNKYPYSSLAKMDGRVIDKAEKEISKAASDFNNWYSAAKADGSSVLKYALTGTDKGASGKLKNVAKTVANHTANVAARKLIQSAQGRAKQIIEVINGKDKDAGLKGTAHYGNMIPKQPEDRNRTDSLNDMWKNKTLVIPDFKAHPMSIEQLKTLQTTINNASTDPAAAGVKKGVDLSVTLKNLNTHLTASTKAQTEYERLLKKASAQNATDDDRKALEDYIEVCKTNGVYVGTVSTRVEAISRGKVLQMTDISDLQNLQKKYELEKKNQDAYGYSDKDKANIQSNIDEITKRIAELQKNGSQTSRPRDKDPNLNKLLNAIETPLRQLIGVEFKITQTDSKETSTFKPTWSQMYNASSATNPISYSDSAITNKKDVNVSGAAPVYDAKYKALVDQLNKAVIALKNDTTWGSKPFSVHGTGSQATAFVKESAFGIGFSSGLTLMESCEPIDLSAYDAEHDDILDAMDET